MFRYLILVLKELDLNLFNQFNAISDVIKKISIVVVFSKIGELNWKTYLFELTQY